ncbi:MAG: DNA-protecting protein DprA [Gammaproteobacteria bacterium]|nr:DNA-protecting protein DprA [Gammaproteobacteria bacterium]
MQKELLADFLHLYHSIQSASTRLPALLTRFDDNPRRLLESSTDSLRTQGLRHDAICRLRGARHSQVDIDLEWAERDANQLLCYSDNAYPELLRQTTNFPALLYARGNTDLLSAPQIAIVGSRNCTPGGAQNAFDFAAQCASAGLVVTSGMALGIDSAAHRGALSVTDKTVAVTATGQDQFYPSRNRALADEIAERGLVVSEFPLGTKARAAYFPQRNRIISGLAVATLVVEAARRSGSLITARLAAEQGREVLAIPGSIHNPQTRGCHQLIRDGAILVETARDIAGELGSLFGFALQQQCAQVPGLVESLDNEQRTLLDSIGYDPVNCDILVQRSGLTIDKLSSMLVILELNDLIQSAPGGCYVRI